MATDNKKKALNKLKKYTKEEIIYALEESCIANIYMIENLIYLIERKKLLINTKKEAEQDAADTAAITAYFDFMKKMRDKYAPGEKSFKLMLMSKEELDEGVILERKYKAAMERMTK